MNTIEWLYSKPCFVNLGTGEDVTIRELAETVKRVVGFGGALVFDQTKPDGIRHTYEPITAVAPQGRRVSRRT